MNGRTRHVARRAWVSLVCLAAFAGVGFAAPLTTGQAAKRVLGQSDFTSNAVNGGPGYWSGFHFPRGLSIDGTYLFVSDHGNHRVLVWSWPAVKSALDSGAAFPNPVKVLGQNSFTATEANRGQGNPDRNTLKQPVGLASDGRFLAVADSGNNRVLMFDTQGTLWSQTDLGPGADLVFGQVSMSVTGGTLTLVSGNFTSNLPNQPSFLGAPLGLDYYRGDTYGGISRDLTLPTGVGFGADAYTALNKYLLVAHQNGTKWFPYYNATLGTLLDGVPASGTQQMYSHASQAYALIPPFVLFAGGVSTRWSLIGVPYGILNVDYLQNYGYYQPVIRGYMGGFPQSGAPSNLDPNAHVPLGRVSDLMLWNDARLLVADPEQNRVVVFSTAVTHAFNPVTDGAPGLLGVAPGTGVKDLNQPPGTTDRLMDYPAGVFGKDQYVIVADTNNQRLLFFESAAPNLTLTWARGPSSMTQVHGVTVTLFSLTLAASSPALWTGLNVEVGGVSSNPPHDGFPTLSLIGPSGTILQTAANPGSGGQALFNFPAVTLTSATVFQLVTAPSALSPYPWPSAGHQWIYSLSGTSSFVTDAAQVTIVNGPVALTAVVADDQPEYISYLARWMVRPPFTGTSDRIFYTEFGASGSTLYFSIDPQPLSNSDSSGFSDNVTLTNLRLYLVDVNNENLNPTDVTVRLYHAADYQGPSTTLITLGTFNADRLLTLAVNHTFSSTLGIAFKTLAFSLAYNAASYHKYLQLSLVMDHSEGSQLLTMVSKPLQIVSLGSPHYTVGGKVTLPTGTVPSAKSEYQLLEITLQPDQFTFNSLGTLIVENTGNLIPTDIVSLRAVQMSGGSPTNFQLTGVFSASGAYATLTGPGGLTLNENDYYTNRPPVLGLYYTVSGQARHLAYFDATVRTGTPWMTFSNSSIVANEFTLTSFSHTLTKSAVNVVWTATNPAGTINLTAGTKQPLMKIRSTTSVSSQAVLSLVAALVRNGSTATASDVSSLSVYRDMAGDGVFTLAQETLIGAAAFTAAGATIITWPSPVYDDGYGNGASSKVYPNVFSGTVEFWVVAEASSTATLGNMIALTVGSGTTRLSLMIPHTNSPPASLVGTFLTLVESVSPAVLEVLPMYPPSGVPASQSKVSWGGLRVTPLDGAPSKHTTVTGLTLWRNDATPYTAFARVYFYRDSNADGVFTDGVDASLGSSTFPVNGPLGLTCVTAHFTQPTLFFMVADMGSPGTGTPVGFTLNWASGASASLPIGIDTVVSPSATYLGTAIVASSSSQVLLQSRVPQPVHLGPNQLVPAMWLTLSTTGGTAKLIGLTLVNHFDLLSPVPVTLKLYQSFPGGSPTFMAQTTLVDESGFGEGPYVAKFFKNDGNGLSTVFSTTPSLLTISLITAPTIAFTQALKLTIDGTTWGLGTFPGPLVLPSVASTLHPMSSVTVSAVDLAPAGLTQAAATPALQLDLSGSAQGASWTGLTVSLIGTFAADTVKVELLRSGGATLASVVAAPEGGVIVFNGFQETLGTAVKSYWVQLIPPASGHIADFTGAVTAHTLGLTIQAASWFAFGGGTLNGTSAVGTSPRTIVDGPDVITVTNTTSTFAYPSLVMRTLDPDNEFPLLRLSMTVDKDYAAVKNTDWTVLILTGNGATYAVAGPSLAAGNHGSVRFWKDFDGNGTWTSSDQVLGYAALADRQMAAGQPANYFFTLKFNAGDGSAPFGGMPNNFSIKLSLVSLAMEGADQTSALLVTTPPPGADAVEGLAIVHGRAGLPLVLATLTGYHISFLQPMMYLSLTATVATPITNVNKVERFSFNHNRGVFRRFLIYRDSPTTGVTGNFEPVNRDEYVYPPLNNLPNPGQDTLVADFNVTSSATNSVVTISSSAVFYPGDITLPTIHKYWVVGQLASTLSVGQMVGLTLADMKPTLTTDSLYRFAVGLPLPSAPYLPVTLPPVTVSLWATNFLTLASYLNQTQLTSPPNSNVPSPVFQMEAVIDDAGLSGSLLKITLELTGGTLLPSDPPLAVTLRSSAGVGHGGVTLVNGVGVVTLSPPLAITGTQQASASRLTIAVAPPVNATLIGKTFALSLRGVVLNTSASLAGFTGTRGTGTHTIVDQNTAGQFTWTPLNDFLPPDQTSPFPLLKMNASANSTNPNATPGSMFYLGSVTVSLQVPVTNVYTNRWGLFRDENADGVIDPGEPELGYMNTDILQQLIAMPLSTASFSTLETITENAPKSYVVGLYTNPSGSWTSDVRLTLRKPTGSLQAIQAVPGTEPSRNESNFTFQVMTAQAIPRLMGLAQNRLPSTPPAPGQLTPVCLLSLRSDWGSLVMKSLIIHQTASPLGEGVVQTLAFYKDNGDSLFSAESDTLLGTGSLANNIGVITLHHTLSRAWDRYHVALQTQDTALQGQALQITMGLADLFAVDTARAGATGAVAGAYAASLFVLSTPVVPILKTINALRILGGGDAPAAAVPAYLKKHVEYPVLTFSLIADGALAWKSLRLSNTAAEDFQGLVRLYRDGNANRSLDPLPATDPLLASATLVNGGVSLGNYYENVDVAVKSYLLTVEPLGATPASSHASDPKLRLTCPGTEWVGTVTPHVMNTLLSASFGNTLAFLVGGLDDTLSVTPAAVTPAFLEHGQTGVTLIAVDAAFANPSPESAWITRLTVSLLGAPNAIQALTVYQESLASPVAAFSLGADHSLSTVALTCQPPVRLTGAGRFFVTADLATLGYYGQTLGLSLSAVSLSLAVFSGEDAVTVGGMTPTLVMMYDPQVRVQAGFQGPQVLSMDLGSFLAVAALTFRADHRTAQLTQVVFRDAASPAVPYEWYWMKEANGSAGWQLEDLTLTTGSFVNGWSTMNLAGLTAAHRTVTTVGSTYYVGLLVSPFANVGTSVNFQFTHAVPLNIGPDVFVPALALSLAPIAIMDSPKPLTLVASTLTAGNAGVVFPLLLNPLLRISASVPDRSVAWRTITCDIGQGASFLATSAYTQVALYRDVNANGTFEPLLDTVAVASGVPSAASITLTLQPDNLPEPGLILTRTNPAILFLTVKLAATAPIGKFLHVEIPAGGIGLRSADDVVYASPPLKWSSGPYPVASPNGTEGTVMRVTDLQALTPGGSVRREDGELPLLGFSVSMSELVALLDGLRLPKVSQATMADHEVRRLNLYRDAAQGTPNAWDPADVLVSSGTLRDGLAVLSFAVSEAISQAPTRYLVTATFSATVVPGHSFAIELNAPAFQKSSLVLLQSPSLPFSTPLLTLVSEVIRAVSVTLMAPAAPSTSLTQGAASVVMGLIRASAATGSALTELGWTGQGGGAVKRLALYEDVNGDQQVDAGDRLAAVKSGPFGAEIGTMTINEPLTGVNTYLVTVDIGERATPGLGVALTLEGLRIAQGDVLTLQTALPWAMASGVVVDQPDILTLSAKTFADREADPGEAVSMFVLTLHANGDEVTVRQMRWTAVGTLTGQADMFLWSLSNLAAPIASTPVALGAMTLSGFSLTLTKTPQKYLVALSLSQDVSPLAWVQLTLEAVEADAPDTTVGAPAAGLSLFVRDGEQPATPRVTLITPFVKAGGTVAVRWTGSVVRSTIEEYQVAIAATLAAFETGAPLVMDWTSVGPATILHRDGLPLEHGRLYYVGVKARSAAGKWSAVGVSVSLIVDGHKPGIVRQPPQVRKADRQIMLSWPPADSGPSGVAFYEIHRRKGTSPKWELVGTQVAPSQVIAPPAAATTWEEELNGALNGGSASRPGVAGRPASALNPSALRHPSSEFLVAPNRLNAALAPYRTETSAALTQDDGTYYYRVRAVSGAGEYSEYTEPTKVISGLGNLSGVINDVTNYPNPFDSRKESTTINYILREDTKITIRLFDVVGNLVATLTYEKGSAGGSAGANDVTWDGRNGAGAKVASGMYLAVLQSEASGSGSRVIRKIAVTH